MREIREANKVARAAKTDEVSHPPEGREVGYRLVVTHDPVARGEALVEHAEQTLAFGDVAVA